MTRCGHPIGRLVSPPLAPRPVRGPYRTYRNDWPALNEQISARVEIVQKERADEPPGETRAAFVIVPSGRGPVERTAS